MGIKNFLKPGILSILAFLLIGIFCLYFIRETVSAAGFNFAFFYTAYGYPFQYLISGDTANLSGITDGMFLGGYFAKYGAVLINPIALALDAALIYLLACSVPFIFAKIKPKKKNS